MAPRISSDGSRWWHRFLSLLFAILWLVPLAWVGFTSRPVPPLGRYLNNQYRVSCLFTRRVPSWSNYYFQVQTGTREQWQTMDIEEVSELRLLGYAYRIHRIVSSARGAAEAPVLRNLADFIARRFASLHPEAEPVTRVRILRATYPTGDPELVQSGDRWRIPPIESVPEERLSVRAQFRIEPGGHDD